ncbi:MAG: hypothetical protein WCF90_08935 [Methanomicrobiales archaeon]
MNRVSSAGCAAGFWACYCASGTECGRLAQGRTDNLRCFITYIEKGGPVNCIDLYFNDLGNVVSVDMRNPDTVECVTVCTFLRRVAKDRYLCGIHLVKPDMCCA